MTKNLLDKTGGNTKLGKTNKSAGGVYRVAGLSLMPSDTLCPARLLAECAKACLESAGRGRMQNVIDGRQRKADWLPAILNRSWRNYGVNCSISSRLATARA